MVGADTSTNESVKGHVTIRIEDFAVPAVDVAFAKIRGPSGMRPSIGWDDPPFADARFSSPSIQGQYLGERHGEVARLVDRDYRIGAFGARRQQVAVQ